MSRPSCAAGRSAGASSTAGWRRRAPGSRRLPPSRPRRSSGIGRSARATDRGAARSGSAPTQTMVHDRASGTEFEVKVGLVFDGTRRVGRTRRALTNRTYVGGTGSWTTFAERFTATCARLGVFDAERIFFVSDGAAAIRWIRERSFPTAIELLDWYHLVEALRRAIGDERTDRLEAALAIVAPGDAEGRLELLAGWAFEEAGADLARSDKLVAVAGYVAANRRAIEHYAIVPLASSGPMEKGVDLVGARRFKARGMSWFRRGASPLLHLRLLRLNGTWARYWAGRFAALLRPCHPRPDRAQRMGCFHPRLEGLGSGRWSPDASISELVGPPDVRLSEPGPEHRPPSGRSRSTVSDHGSADSGEAAELMRFRAFRARMPLRSTGWERGRAAARRATILEARRFVGASGGVAGAVRMSAGARQRAAIDDQVFLADRTTIKPALQDLADAGRIAGLRGQR